MSWMMAALAGLSTISTPSADVPYRFYNRPGASPALAEADLARCRAITTQTTGFRERARVLTPPIGSPLPPSATDPEPPAVDTIEDCMVTRGWRIFALSATERTRLAGLSPRVRLRTLATLASTRHPRWGALVQGSLTKLGGDTLQGVR
jgi:hypothetical protein